MDAETVKQEVTKVMEELHAKMAAQEARQKLFEDKLRECVELNERTLKSMQETHRKYKLTQDHLIQAIVRMRFVSSLCCKMQPGVDSKIMLEVFSIIRQETEGFIKIFEEEEQNAQGTNPRAQSSIYGKSAGDSPDTRKK